MSSSTSSSKSQTAVSAYCSGVRMLPSSFRSKKWGAGREASSIMISCREVRNSGNWYSSTSWQEDKVRNSGNLYSSTSWQKNKVRNSGNLYSSKSLQKKSGTAKTCTHPRPDTKTVRNSENLYSSTSWQKNSQEQRKLVLIHVLTGKQAQEQRELVRPDRTRNWHWSAVTMSATVGTCCHPHPDIKRNRYWSVVVTSGTMGTCTHPRPDRKRNWYWPVVVKWGTMSICTHPHPDVRNSRHWYSFTAILGIQERCIANNTDNSGTGNR